MEKQAESTGLMMEEEAEGIFGTSGMMIPDAACWNKEEAVTKEIKLQPYRHA